MMKTLIVAVAALVTAAPALAQDSSRNPAFGEATLSAGFDNGDPLQRRFRGGGPNDASRLPGSCTGNVGTPPDFRVNYTAGGRPLIFRSVSTADTTLVINGPDGRWYCDDDSFGDLDAEYRFNSPQSGVYDVWIGVVRMNEADATLVVSER
ncbi:peptidase S1 [Brevundimonas pishanensis]|uniref:peptidase S1 n=1 Tax=Brevundimonas pishanensis TaxID=2896315 RepID=UPI001FA6CC72|nr:peptidase S1 [Brevundimonas pishanensis]